MTRNDLYDLAFRYKKTMLWKKLWDDELFAIKLKNGEIGYISIMGNANAYQAVALFIGEKGFDSFRLVLNGAEFTGNPFKDQEALFQQNCLQLVWETKDNLTPEELKEVKAYAKANGIRFAGKNPYPQFAKFETACHPWGLKTDEDIDCLYEGIEASCLLAEELESVSLESLGIAAIDCHSVKLPLFEVKDGKLNSLGLVDIPEKTEKQYVYAVADKELVDSVKNLRQSGIWETEIVCMSEAVQNSPEETPYFPFFLFVVGSSNKKVLPLSPVKDPEKDSEELLKSYVDACESYGSYPKEVRCRDERTYALLKDICEKTNVKISIYEKHMHALDMVEENFFGCLSEPEEVDDMLAQLYETVEIILSMNRRELREIPKHILNELKTIMSTGILPDDVIAELNKKLKGII